MRYVIAIVLQGIHFSSDLVHKKCEILILSQYLVSNQ